MQTDEQQLIARILDGHAEEFGYFLERYSQEAFAIVVRLVPQQEDAEELVQDAFVRASIILLAGSSVLNPAVLFGDIADVPMLSGILFAYFPACVLRSVIDQNDL